MEFISKKNKKYETEERPFKIGRSALIWKCIAPYENYCIKDFRLGYHKSITSKLLTELERLSHIEHPNILKHVDYGDLTDNSYPFVLFELCDENLRDYLQNHDSITEDHGMQIMKQVTTALQYLHKMGIIHGKIKPENILFKGDNHYVLSDFGYSKYIGIDKTVSKKNKRNEQVGASLYLSPEELIRNNQTQLSDIYSLAFVAYEIFTGQSPINPKLSHTSQIHDKSEENIIDPLKLKPSLDFHISKAILKNLTPIPYKRSKTALRFFKELDGTAPIPKLTAPIAEKIPPIPKITAINPNKTLNKEKMQNRWNALSTNYKVLIMVAITGTIAAIIGVLFR